MKVYCSKPGFDNESLELMFLYITDFRMFKNTGINLNPKYNFKYKKELKKELPTLKVVKNENYINLFESHKLNIKVLCGENGVGKTTIINILTGRHSFMDSFYIVYKDKNDNFVCNKKIEIGYQDKIITVDKTDYANDYSVFMLDAKKIMSETSVFLEKNFAEYYHRNKKLYDFEGQALFSHFSVEYWDMDSNIDMISNVYYRRIGITFHSMEIQRLLKEDPLFYLFLEVSQDVALDKWFSDLNIRIKSIEDFYKYFINDFLKKSERAEYQEINNQFMNILFAPQRKQKSNKIKELFEANSKSIEHVCYSFDDFELTSKRMNEIFSRFSSFLKNLFKRQVTFTNSIEEIIYFRPYLLIEGSEKRFFEDLSSGEKRIIRNKYNILPCMAQRSDSFFYEDEGDNTYHPEWKRHFIYNFIQSCKEARQYLVDNWKDERDIYKNKIYTVILTTHSPYILSDMQKDNIVYLYKDKHSKTKVKDESQNTFAGNIGEMYYNNFFMEETIGEFAKSKIKEIVDQLDKSKTITAQERDEFIKTINIVGDDLLRRLLLDKIDRVKISEKN